MNRFPRFHVARTAAAALTALGLATAPTLAGGVLGTEQTARIGGANVAVAQANDPALQQTVTDEEQFAPKGTHGVLREGHADLGVRLDDRNLGLMVRDDSAEKPIWRHLDDVVVNVPDAAGQNLPNDDKYSFTGAGKGAKVWVIPQTQVSGVPWLGWSTQSPNLVKNADDAVSINFLGHQGPGQFTLFLQPGGFDDPQKLWSSAEDTPQGMSVPLNTHAHANWVFTEPGVHLVAVGVHAKLKDGTGQNTTKILRFSVNTKPEEAAKVQWKGDVPSNSSDAKDAKSNGGNGVFTWVMVGVGVALLALVLAGIWLYRSSKKTRREAEARAAQAARNEFGSK